MPAAEDSGGVRDGPRPSRAEPPGIAIREAGGPADMAACLAIRREVFCIEQGVPEDLEVDGRDPECRHFILRLDGRVVGTARLRPLQPGVAKIERVAILAAHRGGGLGSALMRRLLRELDDAGCATALLHAQAHSESFYRALGFATEGAPFDEAGITHVRMVRNARAAGELSREA